MINDTYGHQKGDDILIDISKIIEENSRKSDYVFRIGGDEFCVVLNGLENEHCECEYEDRLIKRMLLYNLKNKDPLIQESISLSIGFESNNMSNTWYEVFDKADKKMYFNKTNKKIP